MATSAAQLTRSPAGRLAYMALRPAVRLFRRLRNPGVSNDYKVVTVTCRNQKFSFTLRRWKPDDIMAVQQCFEENQYDMPIGAHGVLMEQIYQDIVASGRTPLILDCGANIGASVVWFSARYPKAHIVAIEPSQENFDLLRKNVQGINVDLRQAGVAASDGHAYLLEKYTTGMGCRTSDVKSGDEIDMVSVQTLLDAKPDSLYTPFLLKVDIEGAEKSLFTGDTSAINRFPLIIMEPHDWLLPGQLTSQEFFRFHASAGREFCMRNENVASVVAHSSLLGMTKGLSNSDKPV